MDDFPQFIKLAVNRIAKSNRTTSGAEGYVFDGAAGSQMAFWTCPETAASAAHSHDYDEYMIVVQIQYTLLIDGKEIPLRTSEEYFIARDLLHGGEVHSGGQVRPLRDQ